MKILHVAPYYHPATGGAELYLKEVSERLARRGHEVIVLTTNSRGGIGADNGRLEECETINGVTVQRFTPADGLQRGFNRVLGIRGAHRLLGMLLGLDKVQMLAIGPVTGAPTRTAARTSPDVVTVSNWYCGSLAYQLCRARRRAPFALVGIPLFHTESYWIQSRAYGPMLDDCDAILAMTAHEKRFVESRATRRHTHVVGAGVDPERFVNAAGFELRARYHLGDAPVVGYVGRMTSPKGVGRLIRAMQIVWQSDTNIRLLLAGAGLETAAARNDEEVAQAFAALSPAERSRVTVIGPFSEHEKASIFDALDVFAMPSMAESFGIAYLEAWMRKKAVIGCRIASSECVIEDGVDGLLVRPQDSDELAGAILRLARDRGERDRMGEAGHAKTIGHFTWERVTDRIEHVYRDASALATDVAPARAASTETPAVVMRPGAAAMPAVQTEGATGRHSRRGDQ